MKKTAKSPSDAQQPRYKRVTDNKSPTGRTEIAFKSSKISDQKSVELTSPRQPEASGEIKGRDQAERSSQVQSKTMAVKHEYGREQKVGQIYRSRSKQKKDRLTLNLAKLAHKNKPAGKKEKMPDSIYMQKQQVKEERLPSEQREDIYPHGQESVESKYQYLSPESHSDNRRSMFSEEIDSVISQEIPQHNQQTVQRREIPQFYKQAQLKSASSSKNIALRVNEGPSRMIDASRISNSRVPSEKTEIYRGQHEMIEELLGKMSRQKEQLHQLIEKLQGEKSRLQEANKQLIEAQFNMRNDIELLKIKNQELERNQQNVKYLASEQGLQHQRFRQGFENAFKQTEAQLIKANDQLQIKISQISQLNLKIREAENRCCTLQNEVRLLHTKNDILAKEIQNQEKVHESQIQDIINRYEFVLKERDIRDQALQIEFNKKQQFITQLQVQIAALKQDIIVKDKKNQQISDSVRQSQEQSVGKQIRLRQEEIQNLLQELNYTQAQLGKLSNQQSQKTKMYELELRQRDKQIAELKRTIQQTSQQTNLNLLDKNAFQEMYGLNSETSQSTKAFIQMNKKQTEEMNALRDEVAASHRAMYNIQNQNSELKDRLRRIQQDSQIGNRALNTNLSNLRQTKEASQKMLRAEIESLTRKLSSLQMRLGLKDKEIKEKNKFIQQHLLSSANGRSDVIDLINRLQAMMNERAE